MKRPATIARRSRPSPAPRHHPRARAHDHGRVAPCPERASVRMCCWASAERSLFSAKKRRACGHRTAPVGGAPLYEPVSEAARCALQGAKERRVIEGSMKRRGRWKCRKCTLVKRDRGQVRVHRRGVKESLDLGVRLVDHLRPPARPRSHARMDVHRCTGARGPRGSHVEERHAPREAKGNQPWTCPAAIDGARLLKHLGDARGAGLGRVEHAAISMYARRRGMVVEPRAGGTVVPELSPACRTRACAKVDTPDLASGAENTNLRRDRPERFGLGRLWKLSHRSQTGGELCNGLGIEAGEQP